MRQTVLILACIFLLSGTTPKQFKIKEATAVSITKALATIYNYIDRSNMPHQDVKELEGLIITADSSLRADIRDSTLNKK